MLLQVEIPNIQKQRKHLAKLVLDMDSSRTRWEEQPGCLCWAGVAPREGLQSCPWLCKSPGPWVAGVMQNARPAAMGSPAMSLCLKIKLCNEPIAPLFSAKIPFPCMHTAGKKNVFFSGPNLYFFLFSLSC